MKINTLLLIGLSLGFAGCAEKERAPTADADVKMSEEAATAGSSDTGESTGLSDAVVRHMHLHAQQLDRLNRALAAGDLDAAQTPAYWLSRHEGMNVFPADWQPQLEEMRAAALAVEAASDLAEAIAAAARVAEACEACHKAAGFDIDITRTEFE